MNLSARSSNAKPRTLAIARAIACSLVLLVLPACGIPHLRPAQPGPDLPPSFNGAASPESSALLTREEFYHDPVLNCLIDQALVGNRELKILNEEVQIASNEVLARSGAYLPFLSAGSGAGLTRFSPFTPEGAGIRDDPYRVGKFFPNPIGNFGAGVQLTWQLDIYRQLRNARDAAGQRYVSAAENRNYFVTRLVAEIAENYYRLMGLDKRLENLDQIIALQQRSAEIAEARRDKARGELLPVLRFRAEVQRNQSQKLIVYQDIVVTENRINFLVNRVPQPVERDSSQFYDMTINALNVGVPSQLVLNRPDIRQAERDLAANGLDVKVARVNFFPQLVITGGVGLQAFSMNYLFEPQAVIGNIAGGLVAPLVNKRAIRAQYLTANARQLQAVYNYQRTILNAFTEVINRLSQAEKFTASVEIKKQQLRTLEEAVNVANFLFQNVRIDSYLEVLTAQNALFDGRVELIEAKTEQLASVVNTYQALGGGLLSGSNPAGYFGPIPFTHTVRDGETFRTISQQYYKSERFAKALWAANKANVPAIDRLATGDKIIIPRPEQLDASLIEPAPPALPALPAIGPAADPANDAPPPPPAGMPGPFAPLSPPPTAGMPGPSGPKGDKDPAVKPTRSTNPPASPPQPATTGA